MKTYGGCSQTERPHKLYSDNWHHVEMCGRHGQKRIGTINSGQWTQRCHDVVLDKWVRVATRPVFPVYHLTSKWDDKCPPFTDLMVKFWYKIQRNTCHQMASFAFRFTKFNFGRLQHSPSRWPVFLWAGGGNPTVSGDPGVGGADDRWRLWTHSENI